MISIVIPALNEEKYIGALLDKLLVESSVIDEIWVCDAGSTDNTKQIVEAYITKEPKVKYLPNPDKYVSHAFNKVYALSKAKYIALLGAHALYPSHFLSSGLSYLEAGETDVVGGPLVQVGEGAIGEAIAFAMSSKVGVGNTDFRTTKRKMYVDSVAFAIYNKEMLLKTGLLNTSLIRNQDDEFHYRIKSMGYQILMVPEMECTYYVRDSIPKLYKQYFGYGYYKPLVLKLVSSGLRMRHLIPALFVSYLLSLPLGLMFMGLLYWIPLLVYLLLLAWVSSGTHLSMVLRRMFAIATLHIAYGLGFLLGLKWFLSDEG